MTPRTHLVLGGGGAMGAYQAGAVLALFEAGFVPDAVYGCSAGALNAAFLASSPTVDRARELVAWWLDPKVGAVLSPGWRSHARSLVAMAGIGDSRGWLDSRPLARLIAANVPAHDLSELAVPIVATTTCLNCGSARHHDHGPVVDVLLASCALPGLFAPVQFPDGHLHADGGIADGVPVRAALDRAGPDDQVVVIDCGLTAITGRPDVCAAASDVLAAHACGVPVAAGRAAYVAPEEGGTGALGVALRAFAVARDLANRAALSDSLDDPRVQVTPHIADAWASGILATLPQGPRDMSQAAGLAQAGRRVTELWVKTVVASDPGSHS